MKNQSFTTTILVNQTPKQAFDAIKNVRGWWSGLHWEKFEGVSEKINDEFTFSAEDGAHVSKQKLIELIPEKKVVWLVTDSKLSFAENETEWTGTKIIFDISRENNATKIVFTHLGLVPEFECYDSCAPVWTKYIQERLLLNLINAGKKEDVVIADATL
jgi:hypothetical protein